MYYQPWCAYDNYNYNYCGWSCCGEYNYCITPYCCDSRNGNNSGGGGGGGTNPTGLPPNIVIGYWENWPSTPNLRLRNVSDKWDVVVVSFALANGSAAEFTPDPSLYANEQQFIDDVKFLQARGQKVIISLGGATDNTFTITNTAQRDSFANSLISIINRYGFDGLDIDIEHNAATGQDPMLVDGETSITSPTKPFNQYIINILRTVKAAMSSGFILSVTPEFPYVQGGAQTWGSYNTPGQGIYGGYLALLNGIRDIITYIAPQYYNNDLEDYAALGIDNRYDADMLVRMTKALIDGFHVKDHGFFQGFPPSRVVFTVLQKQAGRNCSFLASVPGGQDCGAMPVSTYETALATLLAEYPDFRGIGTWSINIPLREGGADDFADKIHADVIDPLARGAAPEISSSEEYQTRHAARTAQAPAAAKLVDDFPQTYTARHAKLKYNVYARKVGYWRRRENSSLYLAPQSGILYPKGD
ncbi:MAG: hypothetical protein LBD16_06245 [Oscillospiraceae bacterium]|jgi:chitinase|nr:hypothetical protein [Oscillospiraceae bacterium]